MIYKGKEDNKAIKKELYKLLVINDKTWVSLSREFGMSSSQMAQKFTRKFLLLKDLIKIADAVGYDVDITFKKR